MGQPTSLLVFCDEFIVAESKPGEVKHLSTRRKINQIEIPLVVASERGAAQTLFKQLNGGLWDLNVRLEDLVERSGKCGHRG
jgi:acetolactate synthase regulatory subunit